MAASGFTSLGDEVDPLAVLRLALSNGTATDLVVKYNLAALVSLRDRHSLAALHELLRDWSVPAADQATWKELSTAKQGDAQQQTIKRLMRQKAAKRASRVLEGVERTAPRAAREAGDGGGGVPRVRRPLVDVDDNALDENCEDYAIIKSGPPKRYHHDAGGGGGAARSAACAGVGSSVAFVEAQRGSRSGGSSSHLQNLSGGGSDKSASAAVASETSAAQIIDDDDDDDASSHDSEASNAALQASVACKIVDFSHGDLAKTNGSRHSCLMPHACHSLTHAPLLIRLPDPYLCTPQVRLLSSQLELLRAQFDAQTKKYKAVKAQATKLEVARSVAVEALMASQGEVAELRAELAALRDGMEVPAASAAASSGAGCE